MPTAILAHGFNVRNSGATTTDRLRPFLEEAGFDVLEFDYGWFGLFGVRFYDDNLAKALAGMTPKDAVFIGHSNGCTIGHLAAHQRARFAAMVYINPALDSKSPLAPQVRSLHVWHSPSDEPVRWARFIPSHPWGDMGAVGYQGHYDPRITNFNKENGYPISSKEHSDVFTGERLKFFGPLIVSQVKQALENT